MILFLLAWPTLLYSQGKPSGLFAVKLHKVTESVYVAYRPEPLRYFVEGNVTILINEQDVVVVDAGGAPLAARNTIAEIRKLTPKPPGAEVAKETGERIALAPS